MLPGKYQLLGKKMVIYVPEQRTNHFSLIGLVYSGIFTLPTNWSKQKIKSANISVTRIPVPGNVTRIWDSKIFWYHLWECFFFKTSLRIATLKKNNRTQEHKSKVIPKSKVMKGFPNHKQVVFRVWGYVPGVCWNFLVDTSKVWWRLPVPLISTLSKDSSWMPPTTGGVVSGCVCVCVYFVSENKTTKTTHICNKNGVLGDHWSLFIF